MLQTKKMNMMKIILQSIAISLLACLSVQTQEFKESVEVLSKKAVKGHLYDISRDESGKSLVTYKMKIDKSSEEVTFEEYSFDKDLKFLGSKDSGKEGNEIGCRSYQFYCVCWRNNIF